MDALVNTTYYPAILLRKRWREATAAGRGEFDIQTELMRIEATAPLTSLEVSALERWSALAPPPVPGTLCPNGNGEAAVALPPLRPATERARSRQAAPAPRCRLTGASQPGRFRPAGRRLASPAPAASV